jgi:hypothetical protein
VLEIFEISRILSGCASINYNEIHFEDEISKIESSIKNSGKIEDLARV